MNFSDLTKTSYLVYGGRNNPTSVNLTPINTLKPVYVHLKHFFYRNQTLASIPAGTGGAFGLFVQGLTNSFQDDGNGWPLLRSFSVGTASTIKDSTYEVIDYIATETDLLLVSASSTLVLALNYVIPLQVQIPAPVIFPDAGCYWWAEFDVYYDE